MSNSERGVPEGVDRRKFLQAGAAGAFALTAGGVLVACGSNDSGGGTATSGGGGGASGPIAVSKAPTAPFDPNVKAGPKPDLPRRMACSLPFPAELFTSIDGFVKAAAEAKGLEYISAQANSDSPKQFQQTQDFMARGVGALLCFDLAPPALEPLQLRAIEKGIAVFCGPFKVSTSQMAADQYKVGHAAGAAAVKWIDENMGGKAEVAMFNQDQVPSQRPKYRGVRDALREGGAGIELVADSQSTTLDAQEAFRITNTVLQKNPNVKVWVGGDGPLGGTLSALEAAGKDGDSALFGVGDGDKQALDSILEGGAYKSTQGFSYPVVAHAWGTYAADWLDGKSIPLLISLEASELNSQESIETFRAADRDPASGFADNESSFKYFRPLGNTSYEQHKYLTVLA